MSTTTAITMHAVESSQIAAIGHCPATETLAIQFFRKGEPADVYHYANFTAAEYAAFAGAESVGKHFKAHIKPHDVKHPYTNMGTPSAAPAKLAKEVLAALLTGREYTQEISEVEEAAAKAAGLLVIFGGSDDLMGFRGAEHDERGAPTIALIDAKGLLPYREDIQHDDEALKDYFARAPFVRPVDALWCKEDGYSWTFRTEIPHTTFEIVEGNEKYCRGIVIDLADLARTASLDHDHALALDINARCYGAPLPSGQRYSRNTFKDNGYPILLDAEGKRSVFCDLCDDMEDAA